LPDGYRVYFGSFTRVGFSARGKPDVAVGGPADPPEPEPAGELAPDATVAATAVEPDRTLFIQRAGRLVAAVEVVSPGNKDRIAGRAEAVARYAGYLRGGIHLLLIDVHARPRDFSFADALAMEAGMAGQPPLPPPAVTAYRVGGPAATGGTLLDVWRRSLTVGQPLPTLPLPLARALSVPVDLEGTYMRAAADAYLT
jgi:hypothetical protein